jgi:autotransporter translocation and assembly factor TamB
MTELRRRELVLSALVDDRSIEKLPELVRPKDVKGTLRAEATLRGTLATPILSLKAALGAVTLGDEVQSRPFDACLRAQYDPAASRFGLGGEVYIDDPRLAACAGRRVAIANAAGDFDLAAARAGKRAFRGDAQLSLEELPLEFVTPLARAHIAGRATGRAALVQTGGEPQISAHVHLEEATVRTLELGQGEIEVRSNGPDVRANVSLKKSDGSLLGEGRAGLDWEGLVPSVDQTRPLSFTGDVANVDAAVLQPLLEDVVAGLEGRLDGNIRLALVPVRAADGTVSWTGDVGGKASLDNGSLQLAGFGMRLSALRFEAEAKKVGGRTVVSVRRLSAASRSKNPNVSASADLYLDGLAFESGRANVNLRDVPLMIQGSPQATLTGTASVELERRPDRVYALVKLPKMVAQLPHSSGSGVLSVDANPDIEILQPIAEPTLRSSSGGLPWELELELGKGVTVRRADLQVPIEGVAKIALGRDVEVTGDIDLESGGRVQLLGKGFVIEQGEVHFDTGDPTNPNLRVLASWRAPDQTIVYVEVRGTFRQASLRLQSDPARSEAEIQALLLGGGGNESGDAQTAGVGYGADFVNELLADTNLPHVELRTGSESSGDDRRYQTYTAAVQISEQVWFEGSYKNLSTTETTEQGDAVSGTVDWRFKRNWSLRTEIGNIGTGVDLLWQYRY